MVVRTGVDIDRPLLHSSYVRALQIVCVVAVGVMGLQLMNCLFWRDIVLILLVCYDRSNPLRYVYARLRQIVTSVWHVRVLV